MIGAHDRPHRRRSGRPAVLLVALLVTAAAIPSAAAEPERYLAPVDAPIIERFRPPEHDWLPGNRGLKFGTEPGQRVIAIGSGTVTFAGRIAGDLHVTVTHPDGLRSSYAFLGAIRVREGDRVRGGDLVGTAAELLHLGIRRGDRYLDPEAIIGTPVGAGRVRLVPVDDDPDRAVGRADHPPGGSDRPVGPPVPDHGAGTLPRLGALALTRLSWLVGSPSG